MNEEVLHRIANQLVAIQQTLNTICWGIFILGIIVATSLFN